MERVFVGSLLRGLAWVPGRGAPPLLAASFRDAESGDEGLGLLSIEGVRGREPPPPPPRARGALARGPPPFSSLLFGGLPCPAPAPASPSPSRSLSRALRLPGPGLPCRGLARLCLSPPAPAPRPRRHPFLSPRGRLTGRWAGPRSPGRCREP